jgi:hypothetical protein
VTRVKFSAIIESIKQGEKSRIKWQIEGKGNTARTKNSLCAAESSCQMAFVLSFPSDLPRIYLK